MAGSVNIGAFRDEITIYYLSSQTVTAMGGRSKSFTSYTINADVKQISGSTSLRYGLDVQAKSYDVVCRPPSTSRPAKVVIGTDTYNVVSAEIDKVNQWLKMVITLKV